ncbi:hypothetical protein [Anoxybacillus sp. MB8]|uniref:hypothetical protein n=1 Tax=Anoxybacillus sp. MB8 TaxID=2496850 RepID=UPI0013D4CBFE|nr:hypothetical protein [Anoxybacillus sp. MB8]
MPKSDKMKKQRHAVIIELIRSRRVKSQQEVIAELEQKGFGTVTQSIISKDFKELDIIKSDQGFYVFGDYYRSKVREALLPFVLKHNVIEYGKLSTHPIFIKTSVNVETMLGELLVNEYPDHIVGFVTSSNFLVIYPSSVASRKKLLKEIEFFRKKRKKPKTTE